jgi:hypothetical protein
LIGQLVRQALVLNGDFQHTRSFAGPRLGACHSFEMVRPLAVARSPVTPDPGRPIAIGKYPRHDALPPKSKQPRRKKFGLDPIAL